MVRTASTSKVSASKPYDRPSSSKAGPSALPAGSGTNIGAPSQPGQTSRKGKKAWRKNVDITHEEVALEAAREEERITGGKIAEKKNNELFMVDTVGDVEVAKQLRKAPRPLRSLAILNERSAVPSLTSRPTAPSSSSTAKSKVAPSEKARLRRIARKATVNADGTGMSSADVKAVAQAAKDAWEEEQVVMPAGGFAEETMVKRRVKTPKTVEQLRQAYLTNQVASGRAVEVPKAGVSYNPSEESHARLIEQALEEEKERLRREEEEARRVEQLGGVVSARREAEREGEFAEGMVVGDGDVDSEGEVDEAGEAKVAVKMRKRKTQADRNRALRNKEKARLAAMEAAQRKLLKSIGTAPSVKAGLEKQKKAMAEAHRLRKLAEKERERLGLQGGEKIGKHRVVKKAVEVQLGEDLAETLRQVKPEGNLFRDRFLSLQKKALIEPRVPQLPKKRVRKMKEYEKHAYKRFQ